MDAAVSAAISAVYIEDRTTLERWFELVCATYAQQYSGSNQPDWSQFCSALTEGAVSAGIDSHIVERFVDHMNANDINPIETIGLLTEVATELPAVYHELAANTARAPTDELVHDGENPTGEYDESAWNTFLREHGTRWDGTDTSWDQFKTWFLYMAEQHGLTTPAMGFVTYAEGQSDKVAVFAEYGVTINRAAGTDGQQVLDLQSFPEVKPGDSGEWVEYLDAMLTSHGY